MRIPWQWCAVAVVGGAIGWLVMEIPGRALGLTAHAAAAGQVRIEWNPDSLPARRASGAVLEIEDGPETYRRVLAADALRHSTFTYVQHTAAVHVRLRVSESDGAVVEQAVQFAGKPATPSPVFDREVAENDPGPTREPLPQPAPFDPIETAHISAADRVLEPKPQPEPAARNTAAPPRPFVMREVPAPQAAQPQLVLAAPPLGAPPVVASMPHLPKTDLLTVPPPKPQMFTGPRAGRLIWTGVLGRRGVVEIEGGRPSVGELSGALPGLPVHLRVQPAELGTNGLVVYTGDGALNGRVEPASQRNGWNAAQFAWDPDRAGQLVVLEAPNASNDFKRLALRSDARKCTVIVVDWSVP